MNSNMNSNEATAENFKQFLMSQNMYVFSGDAEFYHLIRLGKLVEYLEVQHGAYSPNPDVVQQLIHKYSQDPEKLKMLLEQCDAQVFIYLYLIFIYLYIYILILLCPS